MSWVSNRLRDLVNRSINQQKLVPRCFVSFTFRHRWASSLQCRVDPESVCSRLSALDNRQTIQGGKEKVFIRCFLTVSPKVCVPAIWMPDANDRKGNTKPRAILCFYANIGSTRMLVDSFAFLQFQYESPMKMESIGDPPGRTDAFSFSNQHNHVVCKPSVLNGNLLQRRLVDGFILLFISNFKL